MIGAPGLVGVDFEHPDRLAATTTPEHRGLRRDQVRLLVADGTDGSLRHRRFDDLPAVLTPGDVLVVNTSATLPAALDAASSTGPGRLHLSGRLPGGLWQVELRHVDSAGHTSPWLDAATGTEIGLPGGARAYLLAHAAGGGVGGAGRRFHLVGTRLWIASLEFPQPLPPYLARYGQPIRYDYVRHPLPLDAYQTVFAEHPGSAEMPSAARPFSAELVAAAVRAGITFAPFVLHCGVSSGEAHEPPTSEWYDLPPASAEIINAARRRGNRVVAVGTTAVRTLETVTDGRAVHAGRGWTDLVITPERPVTSIDGLITGWHEPQASHLALLEAFAGRPLLQASYTAALEEGYLWHEFGDSHLILR